MTTLADLHAAADLLAAEGEDFTAEVILNALAELAAETAPRGVSLVKVPQTQWDENDLVSLVDPNAYYFCENPF